MKRHYSRFFYPTVITIILAFNFNICAAGEIHKAVSSDNIAEISRLLKQNPALASENENNYSKNFPIHKVKSIEAAKILIDNKADINIGDKDMETFLHSCETDELAIFFIDNGADVNARDKRGDTPLFNQAAHGRKNIVEALLKKGADVNAKNNDGITPLFRAALAGNTEMAQFLISKGANVNAGDNNGRTPLYLARESKMAELLLKNGANPKNETLKYSDTPLHNYDIKPEVIGILAKNGVDVNARNKFEKTPLETVNNVKAAEALINNGADINVRDKLSGGTLLHDVKAPEIAELLLAKGLSVNSRDNKGNTPLHTNRNINVIKLLIAHGADINAQNSRGETPLHHAASVFNSEKLELLIQNGAKTDILTERKESPLHFSAPFKETLANTKILIEKGADVKTRDINGDTPLHKARDIETAKLLISGGANVNEKNKNGITPIFWAQDPAYADYLVSCGANPLECGSDGTTLLHYCRNEKMADWCVSKKINVNAQDKEGITPLIMAAAWKKDVCETLIKKGADTNAKSRPIINTGKVIKLKLMTMETPLHQAVYSGKKAIAELLIANGANINARDSKGKTPLHYAYSEKHNEIIDFLISKGADINAVDMAGKKPSDYNVLDN